MPQNNQSITESPEFKEFCKKNNLEVFNQEAINVSLFNIYNQLVFLANSQIKLEEENKNLREMINEIAKNLVLERTLPPNSDFFIDNPTIVTLFDKWNKNEY